MRLTALIIVLFQTYALLGADTSALKSRIYPEKETYILGEPIFLNIEIVNNGSQPVKFDNSFGRCEDMLGGGITIEGTGANRRPHIVMGPSCNYGGMGRGFSCGSGIAPLQPGEKSTGLLFLNRSFSVDSLGTYKAKIRRNITIFGENYFPAGSIPAMADLEIKVVQGTESQLRTIFEKILEDFPMSDAAFLGNPARSQQANAVIDAITTMPPTFLEDAILKMSKTIMAKSQSIPALGILNTERTRARLMEIAEQTSVGNDSANAVVALAQTRDPSALQALKQIGNMTGKLARSYAIWNMGLFGEKAIPFLTDALKDPSVINEAIKGLGATGSRAAVPILVELLNNPQGAQLNLVRESLAQLTHLVAGSLFLPNAAMSGQDDYRRWIAWWNLKGETAKIYNTDHCSELSPLP